MPRLRKVQYGKYKDLNVTSSNSEPIDILEQEEIINNFKKRNDIINSKNSKLIFRVYLIILFIINTVLITVPYYRKGYNALFSSLACLMLFCPLLLAYSTVYSIDKYQISEKLLKVTVIIYILIGYSIVTIIKLIYYRINTQADLIYILPILFGYCILDIHNDNGKLSQAIEELETLKYDYKEA